MSGHRASVDRSVKINNVEYPYSSVVINNIVVPIFPTASRMSSQISDQCLRQWIRLIVAKYYKMNVQDDIIIYTVLGIMAKVVLSDVPTSVKNSYRNIATIMLQKKRLNSMQTELEKLESGALPLPNSGKIEHFYGYMQTVMCHLNLSVKPFTMWYILCLALGNDTLIKAQFIHCESNVGQDFPDSEPNNILDNVKITQIEYVEMPEELILDYNCIITLESVEDIGGYRFIEHITSNNS
ncbi:MAG: hypothetical protein EOP45_20150, partial [Sphingobacteriaceae bacterium]